MHRTAFVEGTALAPGAPVQYEAQWAARHRDFKATEVVAIEPVIGVGAAMRRCAVAVERRQVQLSKEQQLRQAGEAEQAEVVEETQPQASADDHLAELDRQTNKTAERERHGKKIQSLKSLHDRR